MAVTNSDVQDKLLAIHIAIVRGFDAPLTPNASLTIIDVMVLVSAMMEVMNETVPLVLLATTATDTVTVVPGSVLNGVMAEESVTMD